MIIPISTMEPMAITMPDKLITLESMPINFIKIKLIPTPKGRVRVTKREDWKCSRNKRMTMTVTMISSVRAE